MLFVEGLGWEPCRQKLSLSSGNHDYTFSAIAEKKGFTAWLCESPDGRLPDHATRIKLDRILAQTSFEHLIIFVTGDHSRQSWMWVRRQPGRPLSARTHEYTRGQPGDSLLQKLQILFVSLEEEEVGISVTQIAGRVRIAFDVERVTKKFYKEFDSQRKAFLKFIEGIGEVTDREWYASVMLNRLMFVYFIQRKGFLDGDPQYLRNRLKRMQTEYGRDKFYSFYRYFLLRLFYEGLGGKKRAPDLEKLLGRIPYLNGGMFDVHEMEKPERYGKEIQIPDQAFEKIFDYFDQYQWHLDERPLRADNEINPDVLGYIFEKYINQKQMGAYYTKEDITEYISKNTVIPFLFDSAHKECKVAFENPNGPTVWDLLQENPDRYIYPAVRHGADKPLPLEIAEGLDASKPNLIDRRKVWNRPAPGEYGLPTEIWREVVARRQRYEEVREKLVSGEVHDINDFITLNLDIRQFAQDVIENCEGPELLRAFWHSIEKVTILDPTCGSGAFLFAALNILEPLYEACLDRMESFVADLLHSGLKHRPEKFSDFRKVLERVAGHPNRQYFIFKNIILNNLFGVDIIEEAVEICQLRLFLKLAAQVEPDPTKENLGIEPLPDIDFNIRAGNTLVGYATLEEVKKSMEGDWVKKLELPRIQEQAEDTDRAFQLFRKMQTEQGMNAKEFVEAKQDLREWLKTLEDELNRYLAKEYGVDFKKKVDYSKWVNSHQPFHWFVEFYGIVQNGGFDVIIGNPPYVEYSKVRGTYSVSNYETEESANLYAFISERSLTLINKRGSFGFIVPISVVCTKRMRTLQDHISSIAYSAWLSNYAERPSKLFVGAEVLLTIVLARTRSQEQCKLFTTGFTKWATDERPVLFERVSYSYVETKLKAYVIPKFMDVLERSILIKMVSNGGILGRHLLRTSNHRVFYRIGGGRYWKIFTNFQPKFILNSNPSISSRENYLYLTSEKFRDAAISLLSSSLFYWYFILTTNCRDLNPSDLNEFPINLDSFTRNNLEELVLCCHNLIEDYVEKSVMKEKTSQLTGNIIYQEFYPRFSKPIIDLIDQVLARHYGFTEEELDFIINYDIKYRMGREAGQEEGDE